MGAATVENSTEVPQKMKNGMVFWPNNSTSGYTSQETQNTNLREYMHPYVHCNIIYNSQAMEAAQVPINRQMGKKVVVHIYNGILLGHENWQNLTICDSMDGPKGYYDKWKKSFRERQIPYIPLTCGINKQTKQKQTHRCREQTAGCRNAGSLGD